MYLSEGTKRPRGTATRGSKETMDKEKIFLEALRRPSPERRAYLDGACGDDNELRSTVEHLLVTYEKAGAEGLGSENDSATMDVDATSDIEDLPAREDPDGDPCERER